MPKKKKSDQEKKKLSDKELRDLQLQQEDVSGYRVLAASSHTAGPEALEAVISEWFVDSVNLGVYGPDAVPTDMITLMALCTPDWSNPEKKHEFKLLSFEQRSNLVQIIRAGLRELNKEPYGLLLKRLEETKGDEPMIIETEHPKFINRTNPENRAELIFECVGVPPEYFAELSGDQPSDKMTSLFAPTEIEAMQKYVDEVRKVEASVAKNKPSKKANASGA